MHPVVFCVLLFPCHPRLRGKEKQKAQGYYKIITKHDVVEARQ
jgi:hypothetical protein